MKRLTADGIPFDEAKAMVNNFLDKQERDVKGNYANTIAVWFSLEQLNEMVARLNEERRTTAAINPGKETDGVRIYFANYGSNPPVECPEYAYRNTVVFVSTHQNIDIPEKHIDYFSEDKLFNEDGIIKMSPQNRGTLCPPNKDCDCDSEIYTEENKPLCPFE